MLCATVSNGANFVFVFVLIVVEWLKKMVAANDSHLNQSSFQLLESRFEQLRDDCEKKLYLGIEGNFTPKFILIFCI